MSPSAPPMPEDMNDTFYDKEEAENKSSLEMDHEKNSTLDMPFVSEVSHTSEVKLEKTSASNIWSRRGKPASVQIQISRSRGKSARITSNAEVEVPILEYSQTESNSQDLFASRDIDKKQLFTPDKENCSLKSPLLRFLENKGQENSRSEFVSRALFSCVDQDEEEIFTPDNSKVRSPICEYARTKSVSEDPFANGDFDRKQIFSPNSPLFQSLENIGQENSRSEFISSTSSCVSRNEGAVVFTPDNVEVKSPFCEYSQTEIAFGDAFVRGDSDEKHTPDKEHLSSNSLILQSLENMNQENSRTLFAHLDQNEEEIFTPDNSEVKSPIWGSVSDDPFARSDRDKRQIFTPDKENYSSNSLVLQSSENKGQENPRSDLTIQTLFSSVDEDEEEVLTPDQENMTPNTLRMKYMKKMGNLKEAENPKSCRSSPLKKVVDCNMYQENSRSDIASQTLFSCADEDEEENFCPDKENMTPNTLRLRYTKKAGKLKEVDYPKSYRSSPLKTVVNCNTYQENKMPPSLDKENQSLMVLQKQKLVNSASKSYAGLEKKLALLNATADRKPLQSLLVNTTSNSKTKSKGSDLDTNTRSGISINSVRVEEIIYPFETIKEDNNRWTMVVDVACLLNKKSRKELQLLQGLKGTGLIVPRIVIRELDCMLRRGTFFRRTTEVSAALQWIEECMKNAERWIHVQSSAEEQRPVAPTPPSSPLSWFCEEKKGVFSIGTSPFSPCSIQEIVTPTTEDHILECALFFKRIRNDGRLVLLSDDVTLKIKAMSEGVICETAEEFRKSLVNPFSDRFLYKDSSPRGATWTCVDDVVLKDKYYPGPSKKLSKSGEGVKGLKLVLMHNSNFKKSQLNNLAVNSTFHVQ
ncbi:Hypothetical predicted protein [Olea europaea subsp. europaea]|nr:Hypothetical predicted protein [Olea europaea subsp. europaea]